MNTQTLIVMALGASAILITLIICISIVWTALSIDYKQRKETNERWARSLRSDKPFPYATGCKHPKDDGYEVKKVIIWMKQT